MIKHLFFDLDRTLWDFEKNSKAALHSIYKNLKINNLHSSFEVFHKTYKEKNAALWKLYGKGEISKSALRTLRFQATFEKLKINQTHLVNEISETYIDLSSKQTELFPGTLDTLNELKREGYVMHIITNGFKEVQNIKIAETGLGPYFDFIFCSEDIGHHKPSRIIFEEALKQTGANASCSVMIGDDYEVDIVGARNCGMKGILFDPENTKGHLEEEYRIQLIEHLPAKLTCISRSLL